MSKMPCSITDGPEFEEGQWDMDRHDWLAEADGYALDKYGILASDLGEYDAYDMQEDPIMWVDRKAEKYDLTPREDY